MVDGLTDRAASVNQVRLPAAAVLRAGQDSAKRYPTRTIRLYKVIIEIYRYIY